MTFRLLREGVDRPGQYDFFSLDGVSGPDPKGTIRHFPIASSPTEQDYLMIRFAADKQLPIKITMFDSNRNQESILYREEFDK
ncbi:MAG TPA: hypothetical protein VNI77_02440 [Nitrososphaera sp.]|nr:hypothetical protein [Nitrososphaera sp.]